MADPQVIAKQFTDFYYQTFDTNRAELSSLYRENSMLTFEGQPLVGGGAIVEKLKSLPFQRVQHKVTTFDAQPSSSTATSMIIFVTGLLVVDDNENALQFSQVFHLIAEGSSYYVFNDIFRLNYT